MRFFNLAVAVSAIAMTQAAPAFVDKRGDVAGQGSARNSPGLLSGNFVNLPVNLPIKACGNSLGVIGIANPASGNACANH